MADRHPVSVSVANEVRAELARQHLSVGALSAACGIPAGRLYRRLSGDQSFTVSELVAVAESLQVPVTRFVVGAAA